MDIQCGNFDWHTRPGEVVHRDGTLVLCRICRERPVVDPICTGCGGCLIGPDCCDQCLQGTIWEDALCGECSNELEYNIWRVIVHADAGEWTEFCEFWCQGADARTRSAAVLAEWSEAQPAVRIERTREQAGEITVVDCGGVANHVLTAAEKSWFRVWCKEKDLYLPGTPEAQAAGMGTWWLGQLLPPWRD